MGRPADENLPEVVANQPNHLPPTFDPSPEVASPYDTAHQHYFTERDKYPAIYDSAPKLTYDPNDRQVTGKVSALSPASAMPWENLQAVEENATNHNEKSGATHERKQICGLRRRIFIIIIVALAIIIAAAVGGGVGATVSRSASSDTSGAVETRSSNRYVCPTCFIDLPSITSDSSSSGPHPSMTPASSSSSITSTTSSTVPSPTVDFLNNQTGVVGLAFQGFENPEYLGRNTSIIREEGYYDLDFNCNSYVWLPNNTNCCITFCYNETTSAGWRCDPRYRREIDDGRDFPRINIWCDRINSDKFSKKCS